ncbi:MAG: NAD(P)H-dependent oxidoreductase subunit E [Bacteroidales bacterium]
MKPEEILQMYEPCQENLLAVLHQIQEHDPGNHVSGEAVRKVAAWMKVPVSSVYGVLKYYAMYSTEPRAQHIIRVCNSVVCALRGGEALKMEADALAMKFNGGERPLFSVEHTECLGHCESSPVVMFGDETHGHATAETIEELMKQHQKGGSHDQE